jgi:flap endonuclease-1
MQVLQKARGPRRREVAAALAESVSGTPANIAFPIQPSPSPPLLENQVEDDWKDSELYQLFRETPGTSTEETVRRLSDMDPWEHVINPTLDPTRAEVNGRYADSPVPSMPQNMLPTIAQRELPALLKDLYSSFYQSVQKLNPEAKGSEGTTEHTISKRQIALAAEEKEVWNDLLNALSSSRPIKSIGSRLISMGEQSALISKSFQRRLDVPTAQTHAESKDILRAMGVPYLETDGPFEAEGLASSIVRRGHADYVISEDTVSQCNKRSCIVLMISKDVLVYQAPLLRNITYRKGPLSLIHGAEVRDALGLTDAGWIDYALLLGTDFTQRIPLVGPARALAFMRKHGRIEDILAEEKAYPPRGTVEDYLDRVHQARHVFNTLPPIPPLHMLRNRSQNDGEVEAIMATYHLHTDMWESGTENDIAMGENYFKDSPAGFAPYL